MREVREDPSHCGRPVREKKLSQRLHGFDLGGGIGVGGLRKAQEEAGGGGRPRRRCKAADYWSQSKGPSTSSPEVVISTGAPGSTAFPAATPLPFIQVEPGTLGSPPPPFSPPSTSRHCLIPPLALAHLRGSGLFPAPPNVANEAAAEVEAEEEDLPELLQREEGSANEEDEEEDDDNGEEGDDGDEVEADDGGGEGEVEDAHHVGERLEEEEQVVGLEPGEGDEPPGLQGGIEAVEAVDEGHNVEEAEQVALVRGDVLSLVERINPDIPTPRPVTQGEVDAGGWGEIVELGGWGCILCQSPMLDECPAQHQEAFVSAWEEILNRLEGALNEEEMDRALMWLLFIPQLLRKPTRGSRAGRGQVAKRFRALQQGDWGSLVEMHQTDLLRLQARRGDGCARRIESEEEKLARVSREAVSLISRGHVSKAVRRLLSHGVASTDDPAILLQLQAKYPAKGKQLPNSVVKGDPVPNLSGLREELQSLAPGTAPGCGGLRPEYLSLLGRQLSEAGFERMKDFGMKYLQGSLRPWFYVCWLSVQTVPIFKSAERESVRPLGLRNPLLKTFHRMVSKENRNAIKDFVEPQQVVLSRGGAGLLITSVRESLELKKEDNYVCVKLDIQNAFNEVFRAETIKVLSEAESLQHLAAFAGVTLAPEHGLEFGGRLWGKAPEGGTQGDPKTGDEFCVTLQPSLELLDAECKAHGGFAMGGADDIFAFGPRGVVLAAVSRFAAEVGVRCGLNLQWGKTEYFCWQGGLPEGSPAELKLAGEVVDDVFRRGFLCWGVPIGEEQYVAAILGEKVEEIVQDATTAVRSLQLHRQAAWAVLKRSVWSRFEYWAMHCYPSDSLPAARELDHRLWTILEEVCGLSISHQSYRAAEDGKCSIQAPVGCTERENWSFAAWVARQPVKLGGMGLRSMAELCLPAFLGAMEQTLPQLYQGFCPVLTPVVGGEEEHGEGASDLGRWRVLLDSGSRVLAAQLATQGTLALL